MQCYVSGHLVVRQNISVCAESVTTYRLSQGVHLVQGRGKKFGA